MCNTGPLLIIVVDEAVAARSEWPHDGQKRASVRARGVWQNGHTEGFTGATSVAPVL